MSAELEPQCYYQRPRVYRERVSRSAVAYAAACRCGWRFVSEGARGDGRSVRVTAECEALLHYMPLITPERLADFRRLVPACLSHGQVEVLLDLVAGYRVHSSAYGVRGSAAKYRASYDRIFQAFVGRLKGRGAYLVFRTGPRGGVSSGTYELVGVNA